MIYNDPDNGSIKVASFNTDVRVAPINDINTDIVNGIVLYCDGMHRIPEQKVFNDVDVKFINNSIILHFTKAEAINVIIEKLQLVREGMNCKQSIEQVLASRRDDYDRE